MALSPDDVQPTHRPDLVPLRRIRRIAPQDDVHAPPGHVRRDRHRARPACLRDDLRFTFVLFGIEDFMGHPPPAQHLAQLLILLDAARAHQHRPALAVPPLDLRHHRADLRPLGLVDEIGCILADHRFVRGDDDDGEIVNLLQFLFLRLGRAGHPRQFGVHAEVVLNGDGRQSLALPFDPDVLFRLDRLVQAIGVPAAQHQPAGEFVHNDHLAVLHHVIHVFLVAGVRPQPLLHVIHEVHVLDVGQILHAQRPLGARNPLLGQRRALQFLIHGVVAGGDQALDQSGKVVVLLGRRLHHPGDDQRGPRLVDENEIHLVHDCIPQLTLHQVLRAQRHVVAQIIETELAHGAVRHVCLIRLPAGHRPKVVEPVVGVGVRVGVGGIVQPAEVVGDSRHGQAKG